LALALIPLKNNKEYLSKSDMGMWETLIHNTPSVSVQSSQPTTAEYTANLITPEAKPFEYYIIGGSFKSEENANKYIHQLKKQGIAGQNLGVFLGLHRIAIEGFSTIGEAQKELNILLNENPQSGVWIAENE